MLKLKGVVEQVKYESKPPKRMVKIISLEDLKSTWWIEFRKELKEVAEMLKNGDKIEVTALANARESKTNTHNNIIAKCVIRL